MDEFDEDEFEDIIQDNFNIVAPAYFNMVAPASAHPAYEIINTVREKGKPVENKSKAIDGIIVLILFGASIFFLTWAAFDIGWDHLRLITGLFLFSVLVQYSKMVDRKNK